MNCCSPSFLEATDIFERTLMQCRRYEETVKHKGTLGDLQCE